ncbi:hypothetical protein [Tumebacillus amylolyticus]|nr:hypothetical protein [Tumebacillus amylolyticus]
MKKRVSLALAGLLAGSVLPGVASASRLYPILGIHVYVLEEP